MPGGRLTQDNRRYIASGLAEGLSFAEIARRLGRPTSTISREVTRNGGARGYRADHAHQATDRRARRKPVAAGQPPDTTDSDAVRDFADQFAASMVQMGLPRMAARVLTCLYTTDSGSLTAAEMVRRLRVSPASISKAIGYLEGLEMVRRERDPQRRHERYVVDDDVWYHAWSANARTNASWADIARQGAEIFDPATPAGARLEHVGQFLARLSEEMDTGAVDPKTGEDALTVLAALVHAGKPLTADELAAGLDWPADRVASALLVAEQYPAISDPVALQRAEFDAYTFTTRSERLTTRQRAAFSAVGRP